MLKISIALEGRIVCSVKPHLLCENFQSFEAVFAEEHCLVEAKTIGDTGRIRLGTNKGAVFYAVPGD